MMKKSGSRFQQILLGIGIMIVLVAFVMYSISVFYEEPKYENFCKQSRMPKPLNVEGKYEYTDPYPDAESCEKVGGQWNPNYEYPKCPRDVSCPKGYCDPDFTCRKEHETALKIYERNVFMVSATLGVFILVAGLLLKVETVGLSIMAGGLIILLISIIRYWGELSKYFRVILLGLLLAFLIWIGYKKFGKQEE